MYHNQNRIAGDGLTKFKIRNHLRDKARLIEEGETSYINTLNAPADKNINNNNINN
jgi:hypothetical protein